MKLYIEALDERNKVLKKLLKEEFDITDNIKECEVAVFAPNKKWTPENVKDLPEDIIIFAGKADDSLFKKQKYINFLQDQRFAIRNANLTAEGVLALILSETNKSIFKQKVVILGLGRCGKAQALLFKRLGLEVSAVAFREEDFNNSNLYMESSSFCLQSGDVDNLISDKLKGFDIIINNNIFEKQFDNKVLDNIKQGSLFIEVAAANPCLDIKKDRHFKYITAPGLPSKYSAESAAELMFEVVVLELLLKKEKVVDKIEMTDELKPVTKNIGFGITGSFCTHDAVLLEIERLVKKGYNIVPILSPSTSNTDTRFGKAEDFKRKLKELTGNKPIETMTGVEPLGPKGIIDALVIVPCTGNTLSKLASAVSDTPVTMAAKSLMRNYKPIIISISTNDALGFNLGNISKLISAKGVYFVPFGQDDSKNKPKSIISDVSLIEETLVFAEKGVQLQPILRGGK